MKGIALAPLRYVALAPLLALLACHTLPPRTPPTPRVGLRVRRWLVGDPMLIWTSWHGRCVRKTVGLGEDAGDILQAGPVGLLLLPVDILSELRWDESKVDCARQPYTIEVDCGPACVQSPPPFPLRQARPPPIRLTVREPGSTRISIRLRNRRTAQVFEVSEEVQFVDPAQIELQCFDPLEERYLSCADRALDPESPFVRVALDDETVFKVDLNASGTALDVTIDALHPSSRTSLVDVLRVRPLPPGRYTVDLRLRGNHLAGIYTHTTTVRRSVQIAHSR